MHQTGRPRQGPVNPARRSEGPASVGGRRGGQWSLSGEPSNEGSVSRQSKGPKKQRQRRRRDRGEAKHERNSSIPSRSKSRFVCRISRRIISTLAPVFSLIQLVTRPVAVTSLELRTTRGIGGPHGNCMRSKGLFAINPREQLPYISIGALKWDPP